MHDALIVLAKLPVPGLAKTRLARDIGPEPAARLAQAFLEDTLETCVRCTGAELCVCYSPDTARTYFAELAPTARLVEQAAGDLGARLAAAFDDAFARGAARAVAIGTDTPQLPAGVLAEAFAALAEADLVLGPAADGGYSLIGLRAPRPELFRGIAWSTPRVLDETLARAAGLSVARTRELFDVDDRDGLERLERWLATAGAACRHTARALADWRARAGRVCVLIGTWLLAALAGCATVDFDHPKEASHALEATDDTQLGRFNASLPAQQPGDARFYLLPDGIEALAARLILAQHAERSIDAQYFLIKADPAGYLFLDALLDAADRGVRVRLLLDDSDTLGYDRGLFALDAHPDVEVRIFNPFVRGFSRMLRAGLDFRRVNRRMHNKSFTTDNQVTVIGGRNIGGEYFNARPDYNFGDLDVLCFGPVVQEVSEMFDLYWNDELAVPVPGVIHVDPEEAARLQARFRERIRAGWQSAQGTLFATALKETLLTPERDAGKLVSAPYELVYDPPAKARTQRDGDMPTILGPLGRTLAAATSELLLVSPYFVPMKPGIELFRELRARGITCKVVTNSLASTNQALVHTGYYPAREPLLRLGVELYEVRPDVVVTGGERSEAQSSRAVLHTKAFMVDRRHLFIGSFNFDPRSAYINTEMGIVIDSPQLCEVVAQRVDAGLPTATYRVVLNEKGYLRWIATDGGVETVHIREPAGYWRKVYVSFMGLWPIQRQL